MRILLASSEIHPFSKTGGLADMVGALGKYLALAGHEVGVVTPLYLGIRDKFKQIGPDEASFTLPLGVEQVSATVAKLEIAERLTAYFLDQPDFYQRPGLYGEKGADYPDNAERFIFFSKSVVHLARVLPFRPQIVHAHDWQVGPVPLLLRHGRAWEGWTRAPRSCFTIHNLAYQGNFPSWKYSLTNLPWDYFTPAGLEFFGFLNCLKAGLVYADFLTTVSPRYAREITTEQLGHGLDGVLRTRQKDLLGILNGVDYDEWNTTRNRLLAKPYSANDLAGKATAKLQLQEELGLPQTLEVPVFGTVSRLADQKGIDILLGALEEMLSANMQFVLLGSGQTEYERALRDLAARYPAKAAARLGYDHALSHRIEAGCDFFLMPSQFEPCGLNQMYSLRYGTIPIVRATGGLDDSVVDISEDLERADGIKFYEYSSRPLAKAIRKAIVLFENKELLEEYRRNAMQVDFSWARTAADYIEVYKRALAK
ncbi:MAG: glycogen synthase GlgA [Verrucomicrobiales bacterium]|nr:glycogen synthase GlgA [Verrucomicrobiales bacterium]